MKLKIRKRKMKSETITWKEKNLKNGKTKRKKSRKKQGKKENIVTARTRRGRS